MFVALVDDSVLISSTHMVAHCHNNCSFRDPKPLRESVGTRDLCGAQIYKHSKYSCTLNKVNEQNSDDRFIILWTIAFNCGVDAQIWNVMSEMLGSE